MNLNQPCERCPICGAAAQRGRLYGTGSHSLKWLPASRSLFLGAWALGSTAVGRGGWGLPSGRARAEGIYCGQCRRIIIDSSEIGSRPLRFTIQELLLVMATIGGACAGLGLLGRHDLGAGIIAGIPCGGFLGYGLGLGLLKILDRLFRQEGEQAGESHPGEK